MVYKKGEKLLLLCFLIQISVILVAKAGFSSKTADVILSEEDSATKLLINQKVKEKTNFAAIRNHFYRVFSSLTKNACKNLKYFGENMKYLFFETLI